MVGGIAWSGHLPENFSYAPPLVRSRPRRNAAPLIVFEVSEGSVDQQVFRHFSGDDHSDASGFEFHRSIERDVSVDGQPKTQGESKPVEILQEFGAVIAYADDPSGVSFITFRNCPAHFRGIRPSLSGMGSPCGSTLG